MSNKDLERLGKFYEDVDSKSFHEADKDTVKDKQEEKQKKDDLFPWGKLFE
jgi:hypothetical protein